VRGRAIAGVGLAVVMHWSAPGIAQPVPQKAQVQASVPSRPVPGTRYEPPAGATVDDPNRVFGDEAPVFAPLAIVGALGLSPYATFSAQYDDNVARIPDGVALPSRFRSKADWSFRPTVGVGLERELGQQRLFLNASLGRIIYAQNTQLNRNRIRLGGGVGLQLGRSCGGQVAAAYSKRDWLLGSFEDAADATSESTTFNSSLNCATVTGLSAGANYSRGRTNNRVSDPGIDRSFADARTQSVSGNVGYRLGQRGQVGVSGSWAENIFPNQLFLGEELRNTINSYALFGNYRIGAMLRANGSIGHTKVSSSIPGAPGFSGTTWSLAGSYAGSRLGANLSVGQSVNGGGNQASNFSVVKSFAATTTYRVNDAMGFSAGASRSDQDFRGVLLVPGVRQLQESRVDRVFVGADYRLARLLSFSADLNHQRRTSVPASFSFDSTTFALSASARF
jgi:hypothetical protein